MSDRFKFISFEICQAIFPQEMQWLHDNRYGVIEKYPDYLSLLSTGQFSHWHMCQIRQQMLNEAAEKAKQEANAQKKVRDASQLTGGYQRQ
jgi:hypothetical protein